MPRRKTVTTLVSRLDLTPMAWRWTARAMCTSPTSATTRSRSGRRQRHRQHLASSGLNRPYGVAVDGAATLYRRLRQQRDQGVERHDTAVTTLVLLGSELPRWRGGGGAGNVYIADAFNNAIKEWSRDQQTVTTLVLLGLDYPYGVAVDGAGNVYIADTGDNAIKEWTPRPQTVTTLVSSGLCGPAGVAVDGAGNVYIADTGNNAIKEWNATTGTRHHPGLLGVEYPWRGGGRGGQRLHRRSGNNAIKEWNAATRPSPPWSPRGWITRVAWRWTARATSTSPIPATTRSRSGAPDQQSPPWFPRG